MKNNKAQALVEFVLILPVLIIMLFSIIDFGNIYITKSDLDNKISSAYEIIKASTNINSLYDDINSEINKDSKSKIAVELEFNDNYLTIRLKKKINIITPGLNIIVGNPYEAVSERVVKYVEQ